MDEIPTTVKNPELVEKRREQIVLAAIKLFAQRGFHKTTLKDLAEEAGLSQGNIYGYVRSKEDIFFLIHELLVGWIDNELNRAVDDVSDPVEKLRRIVRAEFNFMAKWADGIMLIYQEGHILSGSLMKKFLQAEREHVGKIEQAVRECVELGYCGTCNARLTANLIKSMVDSWVIKRWDLRGHATQLECESAILDGLFDGLLSARRPASGYVAGRGDLEGKCALVVNPGTTIGTAITSFILSRGGRVAVCALPHDARYGDSLPTPSESERLRSYSLEGSATADAGIFDTIEADFGPVDIFVHDLGIGNTVVPPTEEDKATAGGRLEANLKVAQDAAIAFQDKICKRAPRRVVYIAPWSWDKYANCLRYETVKAGVIALTRSASKTLAPFRTNVNCIIPGFISTIRPSHIQEELIRQATDQIPAGILGELADVTDAFLFLATDASKYFTGQVLRCAGGVE